MTHNYIKYLFHWYTEVHKNNNFLEIRTKIFVPYIFHIKTKLPSIETVTFHQKLRVFQLNSLKLYPFHLKDLIRVRVHNVPLDRNFDLRHTSKAGSGVTIEHMIVRTWNVSFSNLFVENGFRLTTIAWLFTIVTAFSWKKRQKYSRTVRTFPKTKIDHF